MIERNADSHKGQNGRVIVVGGSENFHGAPLFSALAAEYAGADLIYPVVPACHAETARKTSLNFIVQSFKENHLTEADVKPILKLSENVDVIVIGPGLGENKESQKAVKSLLKYLQIPVIVDAGALMYSTEWPETTILTPHRGEFTKLTGSEPTPANVQKWAKEMGVTIVCKGPQDIIADKNEMAINETGNALMTVGGTGDALAGLLATLIAQKLPVFEACEAATRIWGEIGDAMAKKQSALRTMDMIEALPFHLKNV
jgi:NAD(P)H-hydrate epimerase